MQGRTFFRIMIDNLFLNNALCKAIINLVNFCNEQSYYNHKKLKFLEKMPLNNNRPMTYENRFIFTGNKQSGADYK